MTKKIKLENELNLMVALDLTAMDPILLKYVSFLCKVWNVEHLYFTHNIKQYKLYDLYDAFSNKSQFSGNSWWTPALRGSGESRAAGTAPHWRRVLCESAACGPRGWRVEGLKQLRGS